MRKIRRWIICFVVLGLFAASAVHKVQAASDLNVTSNKTLTAKFNCYDTVTVGKDATITLAQRSGDPVGLEITKKLVVKEGGKITGNGVLIFGRKASFSGIDLYYRFEGEVRKMPPSFSFESLDNSSDYKATFFFDTQKKIYILEGEYRGGDPFEIKLSEHKILLTEKETKKLSLSGITEGVTWKSSDKSIATVSKTGKVTAKKRGMATITAKYDGEEYTCEVEVVKPGLNIKVTNLNPGDKFYLTLYGTKLKSVSSSDKSVATISKKLKITAVEPGECTITVKGTNGKKYKCKVYVEDPNQPTPQEQPPEEEQPANEDPAPAENP